MLTVSVVIPLWNGKKWIQPCLAALFEQSTFGQADGAGFALDVIVVDNGSVDDSPKVVEREFPQARLLSAGRNLGFAGGCNLGLNATAGEIAVLLNQDTVVQPGWLAGLVDALADSGVGVAGSLALGSDGAVVQHAGGVVDWPLGVARHLGQGETDSSRWRRDADVAFVTGASFGLRRELLDRIGPLDAGFWPGYYEDVDYCWRARDAGYSVRFVAGSVLRHAESSSFTDSLYSAYARLRGRLRFCLKHLPPRDFVEEFLPAEMAYRATVLAGDRRGQIARAYLEAIPMTLDLWPRRGATAEEVNGAVAGLLALCPPLAPPRSEEEGIPAPTQPLLTPSRLDGVPLLGRARRALHQLALFYAERRQRELLALIAQQQETIRRLQAENERTPSTDKGADV